MTTSIWQPVAPHLVPPAQLLDTNKLKAPCPAPVTMKSWAWLDAHQMSSAGDLARAMDIPIHRAGGHLERMVRNGLAVQHHKLTSASPKVPRIFYTTLPRH